MAHTPLLLGHRGWSAKYPENTLKSFTAALEIGLDGLEFDVQLSKDGVPVILHDETLNRTTDGGGKVSDWSYSELVKLNAAARWPELQRTPIPRLSTVLDEVLRVNPRGLYNIEIKVYNDAWRDLVNTVVRTVRNHPLAEHIVFSSFHHECLTYLRYCNADAKIGLLYEDQVDEPWLQVREINGYSVHLNYQVTSLELIRACHAQGTYVGVWTVDEAKDLAKFYHYGADMVISNQARIGKEIWNRLQSPGFAQ